MTRRSVALENALLAGVANGVPLRQLCRHHGISRTIIYTWMKEEGFAERMAWARAIGFDAIAEEMLEIADDSRNDWVAREDGKAKDEPPVRNPDNLARAKLRIDTRLRLLGRWDPKRFADTPPGFGGMGGVAGMIGIAGGAGDSGEAVEPVAIAARLASLLTLIAGRDGDGESGDDIDSGLDSGIEPDDRDR